MAGKTATTVANLRLVLAESKGKLRELIVERDQARDGIAATLEETKCPSLRVLITFYKHYQKNDRKYRKLIEQLKPHLNTLPQDLALELKAMLGMSPDATP